MQPQGLSLKPRRRKPEPHYVEISRSFSFSPEPRELSDRGLLPVGKVGMPRR